VASIPCTKGNTAYIVLEMRGPEKLALAKHTSRENFHALRNARGQDKGQPRKSPRPEACEKSRHRPDLAKRTSHENVHILRKARGLRTSENAPSIIVSTPLGMRE
jgi:hypothetical protein